MGKEELLKELNKLEFPQQTRSNVGGTYKGFVLGRITSWAGTGDKAGYRKIPSIKTGQPKYKEVYKLARQLIKAHDPNFKYTTIQFNKNHKSAKHVDGRNVGMSMMIGLGNYTGGELFIYNEDGKTIKKKAITKNRWIKFNGSIYPHKTASFSGTRYTLIYFKN